MRLNSDTLCDVSGREATARFFFFQIRLNYIYARMHAMYIGEAEKGGRRAFYSLPWNHLPNVHAYIVV